MRLAGLYGSRNAVKNLPYPQLQVSLRTPTRAIHTDPRHGRVPITEPIDLRSQPNSKAQSIGVLGGGITGLTTAWHLSRQLPDAKITLYEKQPRLGGWLDTEIVQVDGGEVLFEWGVRTLRPDFSGSGRATILLLLELGLQNEIIATTKQSPAALNRFVFFGNKLVKMPSPDPNMPFWMNLIRNGYSVFTEPIFKGVLKALSEPWVEPRPETMADESVGDFVSRRFGKTAADNIASAFFHGIYAGDLYKLSARTLLPSLWYMETRDPEGNGVLGEMTDLALKKHGLMPYKHGRYMDLLAAASATLPDTPDFSGLFGLISDTSVYTLGHGLGQIARRLQEVLEENPNVTIKTDADVTGLNFDPATKRTTVAAERMDETQKHDYVVSTLGAGKLLEFMEGSATSRGAVLNTDTRQALEKSNKAVNVAVVNLYYSNAALVPPGFGYLIPRSVDLEQNPERALGVIFGSESSGVRGKDAVVRVPHPLKTEFREAETIIKEIAADPKQLTEEERQTLDDNLKEIEKKWQMISKEPDEIDVRQGQDTAPGTKLTVMLGGHWWDNWADDDLPTEEQCIDMAKSVLARHLKIMETPLVAKAKMNRNCIPQYQVGYRQRMTSVHRGLMEEFQGRLKVAGPWWQGGVGVNDCTLSAHVTAFNIREEWDDETGLKEYTGIEKWIVSDPRTNAFFLDGRKGSSNE